MIIYNKDMQTWTTENPCGGSGFVKCRQILGGQESSGAAEAVLFCALEPGCEVGVHAHTENSEAFVILEGKAELTDGSEKYILEAGDANYCETGNCHGIRNIGESTLIYLGIKLPKTK